MDVLIIDALSLLIRWLHLITGIAWIGASFYFIWLDNSLTSPPEWKKEKGISGDLWAFHGGGIYEVAKYGSSPEPMPNKLHWFKWEAYSTFITGALLLIIVYYVKADLYLTGSNPVINTAGKSILASLAFLIMGVVFYELLVRTLARNKTTIFLLSMTLLISVICWLSTEIFSPRASYLHVGAVLASIMVSNVFFGIIPAQKRFIRAIESGGKKNTEEMSFAKLRSVHNNYFTLPVLFCMISNHYSFLYAHQYNWQILIFILAVTAYSRHFFNLRHQGIIKPKILIISATLILILFSTMAWEISYKKHQKDNIQNNTPDKNNLQNDKILSIITEHCTVCHSSSPEHNSFNSAPAGLVFESLEQLKIAKDKAIPSIQSGYMPLGNLTGISEDQRALLLNVLESD